MVERSDSGFAVGAMYLFRRRVPSRFAWSFWSWQPLEATENPSSVDLDLISGSPQLADDRLAEQRRHRGTKPVFPVIYEDADVEPEGHEPLVKDLHDVTCVGNKRVARHLGETTRKLKVKVVLLNDQPSTTVEGKVGTHVYSGDSDIHEDKYWQVDSNLDNGCTRSCHINHRWVSSQMNRNTAGAAQLTVRPVPRPTGPGRQQ